MSSPHRRRIGFALPVVALATVVLISQFGPSPRPTAPIAPPEGSEAGFSPPTIGPQPGAIRVPVVLVPGWVDSGSRLWPLRDALLASGWDTTEVRVLVFEDPVGSNLDHAIELARAVELLQDRTGAAQVDIVAHSMGGLATRWYLQEGGAAQVRRVATLASPHRGTWTSLVAWGQGGREMHPESEFIAQLDSTLPATIEGLTLRTRLDTHILPNESSTLPGVPDIEICCPAHALLPANPEAMALVIDFLARDPASP